MSHNLEIDPGILSYLTCSLYILSQRAPFSMWQRLLQTSYHSFQYHHRIHFLLIKGSTITNGTAQKMKFSIKDFFSKCDQIHRKLRIWSHLLKKFSMESFMFCAVWFHNIHYMHSYKRGHSYDLSTLIFRWLLAM